MGCVEGERLSEREAKEEDKEREPEGVLVLGAGAVSDIYHNQMRLFWQL